VLALGLGGLSVPAAARAEPEAVTVRGGHAAGFVSTGTERDAPREITDAASLVSPLPGVHVRRLGGDDALSTISIRGSSSSQVAVYLGFVPLSGGADPSLDLATLPLWPGAEARVYRSFAPATLGPGSLGGTLVLRAPPPVAAPRTEVWSAVGSFGAVRLRVGDSRALGEGDDTTHVTTAVSANRSDGDFTYADPVAAVAGEARERTRENARVVAVNGLAEVSLPVRLASGKRGRLTVLTLLQARRQGVPGTTKAPTTTETLSSSRMVSSLELAVPVLAESTLFFRAWGRRDSLAVRSREDEARLTLSPTRTDDTIVALGGAVALRARPARVVSIEVRADGQGERYTPGLWENARSPSGATRAQTGLAADVDVRPTPTLVLAASGRADVWHDVSTGPPSDAPAAENAARATGHVGAELALGPVTLASHLGHLARAPGFVERYGNRGIFLGSPGLRPEAATTVDVGARAAKVFHGLTTSVELSAFSTWAEDLIVFVPQGAYGRAKATNIGEARLAGLEAGARVSQRWFEARASYTYLATANDTECDVTAARASGERCPAPALPGRPAHDLVIDLAAKLGPLRFRYGVDVVADLRADLTGTITVPARALQSVGVRAALPWSVAREKATLAFEISNLGDVRTASYAGIAGAVQVPVGDLYEYPLPGRAFLATLRVAQE